MAVASAGSYASLHLAPVRQPRQHPTTQFFTGRMPFLPLNQQHQSTEGTQCQTYSSAKLHKRKTRSRQQASTPKHTSMHRQMDNAKTPLPQPTRWVTEALKHKVLPESYSPQDGTGPRFCSHQRQISLTEYAARPHAQG